MAGIKRHKTIAGLIMSVVFLVGAVLLYFYLDIPAKNHTSLAATYEPTSAFSGLELENDPDLDFKTIRPLDAYGDKIPNEGRLMVVDLGSNQIFMYQDGELVDQTSLKSQGQIGSFWQTPTGYYEITYTNPNHISSIGNVNMPYSLQYSGNFFIHGWPTYLDGTPVDEGYSGGCIRLETNNAQRVFNFTSSGSKVLVINSNNLESIDNEISLTKKEVGDFPTPKSQEYLLANLVTGQVISQSENTDTLLPLGHVGNFLMAITANEWISYGTEVPQYYQSNDSYVAEGISLVPRGMYGQLLDDTNISDEINFALTRHRGSGFFAEKLITKTHAIGMNDTKLITDPKTNRAFRLNAPLEEWFHLTRYLYFQKPFLLEESDGYTDITDNIKLFSDTTTDPGAETGFAIITLDNHDPMVLISVNGTNLTDQAKEVKNWLEVILSN